MVVPAVVICSTIDPAMSSKGTADERQFLIEFIEEHRSLPALYMVCDRNKKNEQNAKLLNKYKKKVSKRRKEMCNHKKKNIIQ